MAEAYLPSISLILMAALMLPLAATMYRMTVNPVSTNGLVAVDMLTSLTIAAGALATVGTGWRGFLDIGFGIALIGFAATCMLAILLDRRGRRR